jgi:hypothetical protein
LPAGVFATATNLLLLKTPGKVVPVIAPDGIFAVGEHGSQIAARKIVRKVSTAPGLALALVIELRPVALELGERKARANCCSGAVGTTDQQTRRCPGYRAAG